MSPDDIVNTAASQRPYRNRKRVSYVEVDENDEALSAVDAGRKRRRIADDAGGDEDEPFSLSAEKETKKRKTKKKLACNVKPFRFLDLPAELRNEIYLLALYAPERITLTSTTVRCRRTAKRISLFAERLPIYGAHTFRPSYPLLDPRESDIGPPTPLSPQLLHVCKQIHREALPILYDQIIILQDTLALHDFLATIGVENQQHLTRLVLKGWGRGQGAHKAANHYAFSLLVNATNLRELSLDCWIGWMKSPKRAAATIYRAMHHFFERYGYAHGERDAALNILKMNATQFTASYVGNSRDKMPADIEQNMLICQQFLRKQLLSQ